MSTSTTDPLIGRLIDGRYQVRSRIARGGMATVYLATDQRLDRLVAVKIMHGHLADDSQFKERFIQEARSAARLAHPNVVNVFDQGQDADSAYLVMEYLPGITLRELLQEYGALTSEQTMDIAQAVLAGLSAAHKAGIVHRDLKPENVLLADDGRIKIGDFGLARAASANTATGKALLGTIAYLSPELVTRGIADTRSDIYAVGIMMFEMLTGEQPYKGEQPMQIAYQHANDSVPPPSSLNPLVPAEWDELVLWATARDPQDRPADARTLLDQLTETNRSLQTALPAAATQRTMLLTSPIPVAPATDETQVLGTRGSGGAEAGPSATAELARRSPANRRRGWMLFAAVLALAGLAAGIGWWFGAGPGARVTIADVRGDTPEAARLILEEQGVVVSDQLAEAYDLEIEAGLVASTDPAAGESIDRDTVVTIVVSLGPEPTTVPDVVGQPEADALAALVGAGFEVGESILQFDPDVAEGSTIVVVAADETDLAAGAASFKGTPVRLIVSVGPIPAVRGLTVESAQAALAARGLTGIVGGAAEFDNTGEVAQGDVLRVERTSDAPVRPGSTLTIIVSRGQDLVDIPDVVGETIENAIAALEAAGFVAIVETNVPRPFWDVAEVQDSDPSDDGRAIRGADITIIANF